MPDGWLQGPVLRDVLHAFEHHFRHRPGVLVGSDNLLYAERSPDAAGERPLSLAPDVMVAFGVEERVRHSYMVWAGGGAAGVRAGGGGRRRRGVVTGT